MAYRRNGEVQLERVKANGNGHTNAAASVASGLEQEPAPAAKGEEPAGRKLRLHRKLLFSVGGLPYQLCGNSYARATSSSSSALHAWCVVCAASAST